MAATGRNKQTRGEYAKVLAGYREHGENHAVVGRYAGCDWRMAKKLYEHGWQKYSWAKPIRQVLIDEEQAARAAVAERLQKERLQADAEAEKARAQAVEITAAELQILSLCRRNVAAAFGIAAKIVPVMDALAMFLRGLVLNADGTAKPAADIKAEGIDGEAAVRLLGRYTLVLQRAFAVGEGVIQLRRLMDGKPNSIVKEMIEMSPDEAADELEAQEEAIRIIKEERRLLAVTQKREVQH